MHNYYYIGCSTIIIINTKINDNAWQSFQVYGFFRIYTDFSLLIRLIPGINCKNTDIYNYIDAIFCQLENKLSLHGVQ